MTSESDHFVDVSWLRALCLGKLMKNVTFVVANLNAHVYTGLFQVA